MCAGVVLPDAPASRPQLVVQTILLCFCLIAAVPLLQLVSGG
jgi:hypothetical protein